MHEATTAEGSEKPVAVDDLALSFDLNVDGLFGTCRAVSVAMRLAEAVTALADEDRDLLTLVAWEGMSSAEVSAVLDTPSCTVRSRLHLVRTELASASSISSPVQAPRRSMSGRMPAAPWPIEDVRPVRTEQIWQSGLPSSIAGSGTRAADVDACSSMCRFRRTSMLTRYAPRIHRSRATSSSSLPAACPCVVGWTFGSTPTLPEI